MTSVIERHAMPAGHEPVLSTLERADLPDILEMLRRCSRATLCRRFHGPTDGVAYMTGLAVAAGATRTVLAWSGRHCVGLATLAGPGDNLELGVLVEDAWQRRGVGTRLVRHLVGCARADGIGVIRADALAEDRFILRSLSRIGPLEVTCDSGVCTARVSLGRATKEGP